MTAATIVSARSERLIQTPTDVAIDFEVWIVCEGLTALTLRSVARDVSATETRRMPSDRGLNGSGRKLWRGSGRHCRTDRVVELHGSRAKLIRRSVPAARGVPMFRKGRCGL